MIMDHLHIMERPWGRYSECRVKSPEQDAGEVAPFIADHIIEAAEVVFDDFASNRMVVEHYRKIIGLS
jgi:hypothetical protein